MSAENESNTLEYILHMLSDLTSSAYIRPTGSLRKYSQVVAIPTAYGTVRRIHGCTKNLMMISYTWKGKGSKMPMHEHDADQISYVLEGKIKVTIGDETFIAEKGDSYVEPRRVLHSMEALEPGSVTIEVFYPPRPIFTILEMIAGHDVQKAYEDVTKAAQKKQEL